MALLPFIPGHLYNRRVDIHAKYGGSWQNGIAPSAKFPYIFIFSGKTGHKHGYMDGWDNPNVFSYTGEGQSGDMKFVRNNLALKNHLENGKRVFLFESERKGFVKFIDEVEFFDADYFETHDTSGKLRVGIKFFLKRKGVRLPMQPALLDNNQLAIEPPVNYGFKIPDKTERKGLVTSRIGQGAYRKSVIYRWNSKCAVTGFNNLSVLVASHIVPWAGSTNEERLDVHNGILLSPNYDALFDRHLITFEDNGKIILSEKIEMQAFQKIGVSGNEKIKDFSTSNHVYLEKHRTRFNETH